MALRASPCWLIITHCCAGRKLPDTPLSGKGSPCCDESPCPSGLTRKEVDTSPLLMGGGRSQPALALAGHPQLGFHSSAQPPSTTSDSKLLSRIRLGHAGIFKVSLLHTCGKSKRERTEVTGGQAAERTSPSEGLVCPLTSHPPTPSAATPRTRPGTRGLRHLQTAPSSQRTVRKLLPLPGSTVGGGASSPETSDLWGAQSCPPPGRATSYLPVRTQVEGACQWGLAMTVRDGSRSHGHGRPQHPVTPWITVRDMPPTYPVVSDKPWRKEKEKEKRNH